MAGGRRRKKRYKPAAPIPGWRATDLARFGGVTVRTLRYYFEKELIPKSEFRGTATRYRREQLLYLLAINRLQLQEHLELPAIKKRLQQIDLPTLERYAIELVPPGPTAAALGLAPPPSPQPAADPRAFVSERWERIAILPGLDVMMRADASPLVRKLAQQFYEHCVASAQPTVPAPTR